MPNDPERRADGRCAREGCTKKLQRAKKGQDMLRIALARDPFCSARCCRTYHGVVLSMPEQDERAHTPRPSAEGRSWAGQTARQAERRRKAA